MYHENLYDFTTEFQHIGSKTPLHSTCIKLINLAVKIKRRANRKAKINPTGSHSAL